MIQRHFYHLLFCAVMSCWAVVDSHAADTPPEPRSAADIFRSWDLRASRLKTARLNYAETKLLAGSVAEGIGGVRLYPPTDDVSENRLTITLDPTRMLYLFDGAGWSSQERRMVPHHQRSTFDGADTILYFPPAQPGQQGNATVSAPDRHPDGENLYIKALLLAFRPFDEKLVRIVREDYIVVDDPSAIVDGNKCDVLQSKSGGLRRVIWVDPAREDLILQYKEIVDGALIIQLAIKYQDHPELGWIPNEWKADWLNADGSVAESARTRLLNAEINIPLKPDEFRIQFDPGTLVTDLRNGTHFVVKMDGTQRDITREELPQATFDELMRTKTGEAVSFRQPKRGRYLLFAINAIVAIAVAALIYVRRPLRSQS